MRYDGSALRIFINGTIDAAKTAATGALTATTEPLWIGGGSYHLVEFYQDYNPSVLSDMGYFIHEATHIWQRHAGRYLRDVGVKDYEYTAMQLLTLNLKSEEHAAAVQDWFRASYSSPYTESMSNPAERTHDLNNAVRRSTELTKPEILDLTPEQKMWIIGVNYKRLLDEIRDPDLLNRLMQNFPNPF